MDCKGDKSESQDTYKDAISVVQERDGNGGRGGEKGQTCNLCERTVKRTCQ